MKQNLKVRSGNRIVVMFDGKAIGMVKSVRAGDDLSPEPASGIGDIHVQEYVPTVARHTLSVSSLTLIKGNMRQAGILPENGDAALEGLVFDFEIYDKDTGELLRKYTGCTYASGDLEINAHQILSNSAQFMCLNVTGSGA